MSSFALLPFLERESLDLFGLVELYGFLVVANFPWGSLGGA
jgi:hypothetical protein